jgi:hypothetical protein
VRKILLAVLFSLLMVSPVYASMADCHELVMSYILADQDKPKTAGDKYYSESVSDNIPVLMETTGYYTGSHGSHGDKMKEGYCAAAPELYGCCVMVYEAIQQEDGSYKIGEYLDSFEVKDTGYGYSTGEGKSAIRTDKRYAGTIESGIHLDIYRENLSRCWEWMHKTKGKIFAVIIEGKG